MPDFSQLYRKPAGEARRPPTWPGGDYPGIIRSYEKTISQQKKTPGLKYYATINALAASIPEGWSETDEQGKVHEYTKEDLRLPRQVDFTLWLSSDAGSDEISERALYFLDEFYRSFGIDVDGAAYEELEGKPVGMPCLVVLKQQLNTETNRIFTSTDRIVGSQGR